MTRRGLIFAAALSALLLLIPITSSRRITPLPPESTLRCLIPQDDAALQRSLIKKFAQDINIDVHVHSGAWPLDSLLSSATDLMVVSGDTPPPDGVAFSRAFADGTVWAVRADETEALRHINRWITEITASERFNRMQKRYLSGKPVSLTSISQYDRLLKTAADSIGWDWRLLAAVVYHESRFHNEATSSKGARGLMQILSSRYSPEELDNPARNLSVGSRYLHRLEKQYPAANPTESVKFALAAYNLGEGRVASLISQADTLGLDASRWDNVATLLPEGHHTVSYVNNVLDTYQYYSRLYPK